MVTDYYKICKFEEMLRDKDGKNKNVFFIQLKYLDNRYLLKNMICVV